MDFPRDISIYHTPRKGKICSNIANLSRSSLASASSSPLRGLEDWAVAGAGHGDIPRWNKLQKR